MTAAAQSNREVEGRSDDQLGVNWLLAGGITLLGLLVLISAFPLRKAQDGYWSSLLVNLGTALLLFAVLVWLEPKLSKHLREAVLAQRTLADAQQALGEALRARHARQPSGVSRDDAIEQTVLWAGDRLIESGLVQVSAGPSEMLFADRAKPDEPLLTWKVSWDPDKGLCHEVTTPASRAMRWEWSLSTGNDPLTPVDQGALKAFQDQVSTILDQAASDLRNTTSRKGEIG